MTRNYVENEDRPIIEPWFTDRGIVPPPFSMLPEIGVVCCDAAGNHIACGWVYVDTHAKVGFPHWFCVRPGLQPHETRAAARELIEELRRQSIGLDMWLTVVFDCRLVPEAEENGFQVVFPNATFLYSQLP